MTEKNSTIVSVTELNLNELKKYTEEEYNKIRYDLELLLEGQKINQEDLHLGFIGLASQSSELLELNKKLKKELETVVKELNGLKKEREEILSRKEARANRKRLPKRDPVTLEIYQALIKATKGDMIRSNNYIRARLRVGLCLLTITGIRVNELLPLKVHQLKTLLEEGWVKIDRSKRGPSSHKAFLSKQGKQILKSRQEDFNLLYLFKNDNSYIFSSQLDHTRPIRREQITKDINNIMGVVSKNLPGQPNLKSHSFRTGFITQLWKDTNDIEFVRQVIGHFKLDTTSSYVQDLSEKERQMRMSEV